MGYESMTIAELRRLAAERRVALGKSWKKARIVAALEEADAAAEPVEAEAVEEQPNGLAVSLLPGALHADFAALDARIDAILADYEGWEPSADTEDDLRQVARERKYLNALAKELDDRRKEIKREYLRPLTELEGMVNERRDRIRAVADRLKAVESEADAARRRAKEAELREHYEAVAGLLADVVPYERIADPKWLNKGPHVETCKRELEERCRKAAADWETLKALNLEFADEAELRFFQTLDLGDATSYASGLAEDKRRLEAMKAEREGYMAAQPAPAAPVPAPIPAPAPAPQPPAAPEPSQAPGAMGAAARHGDALARIAELATGFPDYALENIAGALELCTREPKNPPRPAVMFMDQATTEQLQAVGKVCAVLGVHGTMKAGAVADLCRRTAFPQQEGAM